LNPIKGGIPTAFMNGREIFSIDMQALTGYAYLELRLYIEEPALQARLHVLLVTVA
jgi:hypothetical protein